MKVTNEKMSKVKLFLMDMDGTVYIGGNKIEGAFEALQFLKSKGVNICFLTNNSSRTQKQYVEKLAKMNEVYSEDEIFTSGLGTINYLNKNHKGKKVYLVGTDTIKKEFSDRGVNLVEENPDIVVLSYDTTLNYDKLCKITRFIMDGAYYIATHPDMVCPATPRDVPDVGSFMLLIEGVTGRKPDIICGKPYTIMADCIMDKFKLKPYEVAMVGDRLYTDVQFGINNKMVSILPLFVSFRPSVLYLKKGLLHCHTWIFRKYCYFFRNMVYYP